MFVGREREVAALEALMQAGPRLVTVVGTAGVGKSRLAREVCPERCVQVGDLVSADLIADRLTALGRDPDVGVTWVWLDGVDGVGPALAEVLTSWLAVSSGLRVLVTARTPLGVADERVFRVEPLSEDDGLRLLLARAEQLGVSCAPEAGRALVRFLDAIPHAICWAAAHLASFPPDELRASLQQGGRASFTDTLRWSLERLTPATRLGLLTLSLFRRALPASIAASVVGGLETLHTLTAASLVGPSDRGHVRVYATVCHAMRSLAGPDELGEAVVAHANTVVKHTGRAAEGLFTAEGPEALDTLTEWLPDLIGLLDQTLHAPRDAVIEAVFRLAQLQEFGRGVPVDVADLDRLLAEEPGPHAVGLRMTRAATLFRRGQVDRAILDVDAVLSGPVDPSERCAALLQRSALLRHQMRDAEALPDAVEALALSRAQGQAADEVEALSRLADLERDLAQSRRLALEAVRLARAHENRLGSLGPLNTVVGRLGAPRDEGDLEPAREGLELARAFGFHRAEYIFGSSLAAAQLELGLDAKTTHDQVQALASRHGWDRLGRQFEAVFQTLRWSLDPAVDPRPALRRALLDAQQVSHIHILTASLAAADAERRPDGPAELPTADSDMARLSLAAIEAFQGLDRPRDEMERALASATEAMTIGSDAHSSVRAARRVLRRAADRLQWALRSTEVQVGPGAAWFQVGQGPVVSLARRGALCRLLEALATAGAPLPVDQLFEAGWPGASIRPSSASHRVHVAIAELRKLGLGDLLETHALGYRLTSPVRHVAGP